MSHRMYLFKTYILRIPNIITVLLFSQEIMYCHLHLIQAHWNFFGTSLLLSDKEGELSQVLMMVQWLKEQQLG